MRENKVAVRCVLVIEFSCLSSHFFALLIRVVYIFNAGALCEAHKETHATERIVRHGYSTCGVDDDNVTGGDQCRQRLSSLNSILYLYKRKT